MDIIAAKNDNAFSFLVIHRIEYGIQNKVVFSYQWDGVEGLEHTKKRRSIIRHTTAGRAYFIGRGCRQYLDEFMRIGA